MSGRRGVLAVLLTWAIASTSSWHVTSTHIPAFVCPGGANLRGAVQGRGLFGYGIGPLRQELVDRRQGSEHARRGLCASSMTAKRDDPGQTASPRRRKRALFKERPVVGGLENSTASFGNVLVVEAAEERQTAAVIWLSGSTTRFDNPKVWHRPPHFFPLNPLVSSKDSPNHPVAEEGGTEGEVRRKRNGGRGREGEREGGRERERERGRERGGGNLFFSY
jgi:hypothetical protein